MMRTSVVWCVVVWNCVRCYVMWWVLYVFAQARTFEDLNEHPNMTIQKEFNTRT
jgi:hypothetical protein